MGNSDPRDISPLREKPRSILLWIVVFSLLCLLSPTILLAPRVEPEPDEAVAESPSTEVETPADPEPLAAVPEEAPPKPEFRYAQPAGFHRAPPTQWTIAHRKTLEKIDLQRPVLMSPNGRFLAYFSAEHSGGLTVFDLNAFETHATFFGFDQIANMAWAPQSDRLFCVTSSERPNAFVLEIESQTKIALPLVKHASFPDTQPFWWSPGEIAFFPKSGEPLWIDLNHLRLSPIESSLQWKVRSEGSADASSSVPSLELPESLRCRFTIAPAITSYLSPAFQQPEWEIEWKPVMSLHDKVHPHVRCFPALKVSERDQIVSTAAGMKLIQIREGVAEAIYFSLEDRPEPIHAISTPSNLTIENADEFNEHLGSHTLCAFVSAPLVNPLTGKVAGPNRETVKGIARIVDWKDGEAILWMAEEYSPVEPGDVVADLHIWKNGALVSISTPLPDHWWTPILPPGESTEGFHLPENLSPIDRHSALTLESQKGTLQVAHFSYPQVVEPATRQPTYPKSDEPTTGESLEPTGSDAPSGPKAPEDRVREFILEHYRKLSAKDFDGYLEDYTDYIVFYGKGGTKQSLVTEELASVRLLEKIDATVQGEIALTSNPEDQGRFNAVYNVAFNAENADGEELSERSSIEMDVFLVGDGAQIVTEGYTIPKGLKAPVLSPRESSAPEKSETVDAETAEQIRAFIPEYVRRLDQLDARWITDHVDQPITDIEPGFRVTLQTARAQMTGRRLRQTTSITSPIQVTPWKDSPSHYYVKFNVVVSVNRSYRVPDLKGTQIYWVAMTNAGPKVYGSGIELPKR